MEGETVKLVLSRKEAAKYLGIHWNTLDRSEIPRIRIGGRTVFRVRTLDAYLSKMERHGYSLNKRGPKCKR